MADETAEAVDPFQGETPTLSEYNKYRQDGEVPERFQPVADSEPADTQEETEEPEAEEPEPEPDSEPDAKQEPETKSKRDKRIQQLLDERNELKRQLAAKQDVKTDPSPVEPQHTRPKPLVDAKNEDGSDKFKTYEDYIEELADWKAEQRLAADKRTQAEQQASAAMQAKLEDARTRYDDADDVIFPTSKAVMTARIPQAVKEVFGQSDVFVDLCYVVGSDPKELDKFIALAQSNPRAAIGKVFEYERGIKEELSTTRDDKGKFASKEAAVPEKKTNAPKPPSPVGGASSRAFDVSDESLSPEEWARKRTAQLANKT